MRALLLGVVLVTACNDSRSAGFVNAEGFCSTDKDCRFANQLCDEQRSVCVDCVRNVDCSDDGICLGGRCRDSCTNSLDCASDEVCDETENLCVDCVADNDCADDEQCVDLSCVAQCEGDSECGIDAYCAENGQCAPALCDVEAAACEDGELFVCNDARDGFRNLGCDAECDDTRESDRCSDSESGSSGNFASGAGASTSSSGGGSSVSSGGASSGGNAASGGSSDSGSGANSSAGGASSGSGGTADSAGSGGASSASDSGSGGNGGNGRISGDGGVTGTGGASGGSSMGGNAGSSGANGSGGVTSTGGASGNGAGGVTGTGGTYGETGTCTAPMIDGVFNTSFSIDTTDAVCVRYDDDIQGWGVSNFDGRTLLVNGEEVQLSAQLPPKINGYYYFDISAGDFPWASISTW